MDRRRVALILLLAFAVRLAAGFWWQQHLPPGTRFGFPDSETYWQLGQRLARGEPLEMNPDRRVFRTPGYPLILAAMFRVVGDDPQLLWVRVLNAFLGTLAVAGVLAFARLLCPGPAELWAGLAAAVCPDVIASSLFVLSETPFCPLMMLQLCLWVWAWKAAPGSLSASCVALGAGLVAGWATLIRPSWLLFTPLAVALSVCWGPQRQRQAALGLCLLLGLVAAMLPWWIRNWRLTGAFVPTTLQVGESLYDGLNPQAQGGSDMQFVDEFRRQLRAEDAERGATPEELANFEARLDRRMRDAAVAWAWSHPGRAVELAGLKFLRLWNVWPNEPGLRQPVVRAAVLCGYLPVLAFGLWGLRLFRRCGWPWVLCWLPAVYFTALHVIFVGSLRYRQPALLPAIVLAAGAVAHWWGSMHRPSPAAEAR